MSQNVDSMPQYFVRWRGRVEGPYTSDRLRSMLDTGSITRHHQVSMDQETWSPLSSLPTMEPMGQRVGVPPPDRTVAQQSTVPRTDAQQEDTAGTARLRLHQDDREQAQAERIVCPSVWFYLENDQVVGPTSEQEIQSMLGDGLLTARSLVCRQGEEKWQPIRSITELFAGAKPGGAEGGSDAARALPSGAWAGFWRRLVATLFDSLIVSAFAGLILFVLRIMLPVTGLPRADVYLVLRVFGPIMAIVMNWAYATCLESSPRQATVGKIAMGIHVVDRQGQTLSFGRANARYWAKTLSGMILLAGFLMAAFTERRQSLHDMIAGTYVLLRA